MSIKSKLKNSLIQILKNDRSGSFATQYDRKRILISFINDLYSCGYKTLDIQKLKAKHIQAAVNYWKEQCLSSATIKNRMSAIRKLAELINRRDLVPSNKDLAVSPRKYISEVNRAVVNPDFDKVKDTYIRTSLELQRVFGLRREEALKIKPHLADKENHLLLFPSWCKGGRGRFIPIRTQEQRYWLGQAKMVAGKIGNSLIPQSKNYIQHRNYYDKQLSLTGLKNMHGLRHAYAQARYKELTGWEAPINGGPKYSKLTASQKEIDYGARMILTEELGHSRVGIVKNYCGR